MCSRLDLRAGACRLMLKLRDAIPVLQPYLVMPSSPANADQIQNPKRGHESQRVRTTKIQRGVARRRTNGTG